MVAHLQLKWGTVKGWDGFVEGSKPRALIEKWAALGASYSAMAQNDTPEQKEILCELIDAIDGEIFNDWEGTVMTKEEAKRYVMEYGRKKD